MAVDAGAIERVTMVSIVVVIEGIGWRSALMPRRRGWKE